jgi:hypothetical protein
MNSRRIQINRRQAISLVLAVLIVALVTAPALAWDDKGGHDFKSSPTAAIVLKARADDFPISQARMAAQSPQRAHLDTSEPLLRPSLARAE